MVLVCAKPVEVPRLCEHTAESAHHDGTFDVCNFGSASNREMALKKQCAETSIVGTW